MAFAAILNRFINMFSDQIISWLLQSFACPKMDPISPIPVPDKSMCLMLLEVLRQSSLETAIQKFQSAVLCLTGEERAAVGQCWSIKCREIEQAYISKWKLQPALLKYCMTSLFISPLFDALRTALELCPTSRHPRQASVLVSVEDESTVTHYFKIPVTSGPDDGLEIVDPVL